MSPSLVEVPRLSRVIRRVTSLISAGFSGNTKWQFTDPPVADVVIIDATTTERLRRTILDGLPVATLDMRFGSQPSRLYVSPAVVARMLIHFIGGAGLFASYVLACLERMRPRVVIDNIHYPFLPQVAKRFPSAEFFVILNGPWVRIADRERAHTSLLYQDALAEQHITDLRNFHIYCFGQKDVEIFAEAGVDEARTGIQFHAVGSMCADRYRSDVGGNVERNIDDVCFISQVTGQTLRGTTPFERMLVRVTDIVVGHLMRFVNERGLTCAVHLRSSFADEAAERSYYTSKLVEGPAVRISSNTDPLSAYAAIADARVTVTLFSSLAFEAAGWGKRAMFCLLDFTPIYRFASARYANDSQMWKWLIETPDYETFRDTLEGLIRLSDETYHAEAETAAQYFANYGALEPAHVIIRRHVEDALSASPSSAAVVGA